MKTCTKCLQTKPLSEFFADNRRPNGRMSRCKKCKLEAHRCYRKERGYDAIRYWKNPKAERERHLLRKYGINLEAYEEMLSTQGGKCAVCRKSQDRSFDVDHDHHTGEVRGLLCTSCNRMVGHSGDSPNVLRSGASYLESCLKSRKSSSGHS